MADIDYNIYIQRVDTSPEGSIYDLESHWSGIKYKQCKGLNDKGEKTSVYTESYADSDELRVHESSTLARKATTLELTLYFMGANKQSTYDSFYNYIKQGTFLYADTVRCKLAKFILKDPVKPEEEKFTQGDGSYYKAKFVLQNIWGECKDATQFIAQAQNS